MQQRNAAPVGEETIPGHISSNLSFLSGGQTGARTVFWPEGHTCPGLLWVLSWDAEGTCGFAPIRPLRAQ